MKKKLFLLIVLLYSCSVNPNTESKKKINFNYLDNLSFKEFKVKLNEYVNNTSYPKID